MFLANENFPRPSTIILRERGISIISIQEEYPGIADEKVIELALSKQLIILTFDSDYGELIFRYSKENPPSVVYFRSKGNDPLFAATTLLTLIQNPQIKLAGAFTVVESSSVRQRFYS